jgi:hypothetical protein
VIRGHSGSFADAVNSSRWDITAFLSALSATAFHPDEQHHGIGTKHREEHLNEARIERGAGNQDHEGLSNQDPW